MKQICMPRKEFEKTNWSYWKTIFSNTLYIVQETDRGLPTVGAAGRGQQDIGRVCTTLPSLQGSDISKPIGTLLVNLYCMEK